MDVRIIETGNGGDLLYLGRDLDTIFGFENQPYLALFGGNLRQSTSPRGPKAQDFSWWGNILFMQPNPTAWFNSETERLLSGNLALNSSGRVLLENTIKKDLKYLEALNNTITVQVKIISDDRIDAIIRMITELGDEKISVVTFKKSSDGDFWIPDFNNDFFL